MIRLFPGMPMTERTRFFHSSSIAACMILMWTWFALAGYKVRPWNIRSAESYPARMTSEGVTIAVDPLFQDALAAQVFDKNDIVTRGIMPVAVAIFNENDFPVMVQGTSVELITGDDRLRTMYPNEVVPKLFAKGGRIFGSRSRPSRKLRAINPTATRSRTSITSFWSEKLLPRAKKEVASFTCGFRKPRIFGPSWKSPACISLKFIVTIRARA